MDNSLENRQLLRVPLLPGDGCSVAPVRLNMTEKMRKKILCVDDSSVVLLMEKLILAKADYHLITAATGREAVDKAKREKPDLILLDVVMPVMDGFEACRHLRADDETREIPIIMVTTRGEAPNVEHGFVTGCNDYVTKPIDSIELLTKVKNYLGEQV